MVDYTTVFVEGKVYWAKIIGDKALHDNYDKDGKQWAYELVPDDTKFLKEARLLDRLKEPKDEKNPDKGEYLVLKKPELNKDGKRNDPIKVLDDEDNDWDGRLLGNGTRVVAKLSIANFGAGKKKAIYTSAIRVVDLVEYEGGDSSYDPSNPFGDYEGGKKSPAKAPATKAGGSKAKASFELDDDVPF